jgi:hypothetical protein
MFCNSLLKPETIDIEQCRKCKNASAKKIWCCKFGFYFDKPLIKTPSKKLIKPKPTMLQMAEHFTKAMIKWGKSGLKCVDKETYIKRRSICSECVDGWRCPHCGCMLWAKVALTTEKCPENKW